MPKPKMKQERFLVCMCVQLSVVSLGLLVVVHITLCLSKNNRKQREEGGQAAAPMEKRKAGQKAATPSPVRKHLEGKKRAKQPPAGKKAHITTDMCAWSWMLPGRGYFQSCEAKPIERPGVSTTRDGFVTCAADCDAYGAPSSCSAAVPREGGPSWGEGRREGLLFPVFLAGSRLGWPGVSPLVGDTAVSRVLLLPARVLHEKNKNSDKTSCNSKRVRSMKRF